MFIQTLYKAKQTNERKTVNTSVVLISGLCVFNNLHNKKENWAYVQC